MKRFRRKCYTKIGVFVTVTVALLILLARFHPMNNVYIKEIEVNFDSNTPIHVTNHFSPSVTAEVAIFTHNWVKYLRNPKFITLVKALKPCYLRIGGTRSDHSHFINDKTLASQDGNSEAYVGKDEYHRDCNDNRMPSRQEFKEHLRKVERMTIRDYAIRRAQNFRSLNIVYTATEFDEFMNFIICTDLKLIFGLNLLDRSGQTWDPSNAMKLLTYAKVHGYRIDWELGNEPNSFPRSAQLTLSPEQVAEGFLRLKRILEGDEWWKKSKVYGPDISSVFKQKSRAQLKKFLKRAGNAIDAATFHHYYINSVNATVENFTDYKILNKLKSEINRLVDLVRKESKTMPIWMGETSSSFGGGADGLSNTYVAGFMWLDKLGICASQGIDLVFRQTLIGGNYALIDKNFDPNPDYWLTLLYKTLVGRRVLKTGMSLNGDEKHFRTNWKFRVYAHCTNIGRTGYETYNEGSVTLYYINLLDEKRILTFGSAFGHSPPKVAKTYILTSPRGKLTSKEIYLNGKRLLMTDIHTMPPLIPSKIDLQNDQIVLPEKSFGFIVLPDIQADACIANA